MLSLTVFVQQFEIMCGWYSTESSDEKCELFYKFVQSLTDQEFMHACRCALREREFFPSPQWLIDQVKPTLQVRALEEWRKVVDFGRPDPGFWEDDGTRHALEVVGGRSLLGASDPSRMIKTQEQFILAYIAEHKRLQTDLEMYGVCVPTELPHIVPPTNCRNPVEWLNNYYDDIEQRKALLEQRQEELKQKALTD